MSEENKRKERIPKCVGCGGSGNYEHLCPYEKAQGERMFCHCCDECTKVCEEDIEHSD